MFRISIKSDIYVMQNTLLDGVDRKIFILEAEEVRDTQERTFKMTILGTILSSFQTLTVLHLALLFFPVKTGNLA